MVLEDDTMFKPHTLDQLEPQTPFKFLTEVFPHDQIYVGVQPICFRPSPKVLHYDFLCLSKGPLVS